MKVLVVGGAESLIQGAYGQKLAKHGIQVVWHEPRISRLDTIPEACEGVLIIKDMVSHSLAGMAIQLAKMQGIPFAQVTRKFSHAFPILRDSGFLSAADAINATRAAHAAKLAAVPVANTPTPTPTPTNKDLNTMPVKDAPTAISQDLYEAMNLIFHQDPYSTKTPALVKQQLHDLTRAMPTDAEVTALIKQKQSAFRSLTGKMADKAAREYRNTVRQRWMVSFMKDMLAKANRQPTFAEVNTEARYYFGSTLEASVIRGYYNIVEQERAKKAVAAPAPKPVEAKPTPVAAPVPAQPTHAQPAPADRPVVKDAVPQSTPNALLENVLLEREAQIENLEAQVKALSDNLAEAHARLVIAQARVAELESAPTVAAPAVPPTLAKALAELAACGLVLKIEAK